MPLVPVYYGDPQVPNITITPSFIRVRDFDNPKSLARYLLYLDANPDEYAKYRSWRGNPSAISPEYIKSLQRDVPGPKEILANMDNRNSLYHSPRRSVCCRLCDKAYVQEKIEQRQQKLTRGEPIIVHQAYDLDQIHSAFYRGKT